MADFAGEVPTVPQLMRAYSDAAKGSAPLLSFDEKEMFKEALRDDGQDEQVRLAMAQQLRALRDEANAEADEDTDPAPAAAAPRTSFATRGSGTGASDQSSAAALPPVPPPAPVLKLSRSASSGSGAGAASVRSMLMQGEGDSPLPPPPAAPLMRWSSSVLGSDVLLSEMQILLAMYPGQIKGLFVAHKPPSDPSDPPQHDDDDGPTASTSEFVKAGVPAKALVPGGPMPSRLHTGTALSMGLWAPSTARFTGETPEGIADVRCFLLRLPLGSSSFDTLPERLQRLLWQCSQLQALRLSPTGTAHATATAGLTSFQSVDVSRVQPVALSSVLEKLDSFRLRLQAELCSVCKSVAAPKRVSALHSGGTRGSTPAAAAVAEEDHAPLRQKEALGEGALQQALPSLAAARDFLWAALRLALEMPAAPNRDETSTSSDESEQLLRVAFPDGYPRQAPVLSTRVPAAAWTNAHAAAGIGQKTDTPLHPFALSEDHEAQLQRDVREAVRRDGDSGAGVMFDVLQSVQEHSLAAASKSEHSEVHLRFSRATGRAGVAAWRRFLDETHGAGDTWNTPLAALIAVLPPSPARQPPAAASAAGADSTEDAPDSGHTAYRWALLVRDLVGLFVVRQGCLMRAQLLLVALRAFLQRALSLLPSAQAAHPAGAAAQSFLDSFPNLRVVLSSLGSEPVTLGESEEDLARSAKRITSAEQGTHLPDVWTHFALPWSALCADTFLGPRSALLRQLSGRFGVLEMHDVFRPEAAVQFMMLWQRLQLRYGMTDTRARVSVGFSVLREGVSEGQVAQSGLQHDLEAETAFPMEEAAIDFATEGYSNPRHFLEYLVRDERGRVIPQYDDQRYLTRFREGAFSLVNTPSAAERLHQSPLSSAIAFHGARSETPNFRVVVCAVLRGVTPGREIDQQRCLARAPEQAWAHDPDSPLAQRFEKARREFLARPSARQGSVVRDWTGRSFGTYDSDTEAWALGRQPEHSGGAGGGAAEAEGAPWQMWHMFDSAQVLPCYTLHLVPLTHVAESHVAHSLTHVHVVSSGGSLAKAPRHTLTALQQQARDRASRGAPSRDEQYNARLKNAEYFLGSRFAGLVQVASADSDDDDWGAHGMRQLPILTPEQATKTAAEQVDTMAFHAMQLPSEKSVDLLILWAAITTPIAPEAIYSGPWPALRAVGAPVPERGGGVGPPAAPHCVTLKRVRVRAGAEGPHVA